jgi:hypothetical protein
MKIKSYFRIVIRVFYSGLLKIKKYIRMKLPSIASATGFPSSEEATKVLLANGLHCFRLPYVLNGLIERISYFKSQAIISATDSYPSINCNAKCKPRMKAGPAIDCCLVSSPFVPPPCKIVIAPYLQGYAQFPKLC